MAGELIILIGLPGAGKTTFFRQRYAATHAHVSMDSMPRAARDKPARQLAAIERALASGGSAVLDNTNARAADRAAPIAVARRLGARIVACFFAPAVGESIRRNAARTPAVPKVAIFTTLKRLEPPSFAEGFDEIQEVRAGEGEAFSVVPRAR